MRSSSRFHEASGSLLPLPTSDSDGEEYWVHPSHRFIAERKRGWVPIMALMLSISLNLFLVTCLIVREIKYCDEDAGVTNYGTSVIQN